MAAATLLIWNKLESFPKEADLEGSLQAEVRDPLWMLSRQWQLGELRGEDAAVPVYTQVEFQKQFPKRMRGKTGDSIPISEKQPLNPLVEAIPVTLDLSLRIEVGQHWIRFLNRSYQGADKTAVIEAFKTSERLGFKVSEQANVYEKYADATTFSNTALQGRLALLAKKPVIDGARLLAILSNPSYSLSEFILLRGVAEIDVLGKQLLQWVERVYAIDTTGNNAWQNSRLEYQFSIDFSDEEQEHTKLVAQEHKGGKLAWYQLDAHLSEEQKQLREELEVVVNIPSPVNYIGMPSTRWWEMEDATVNFGTIKTDGTNPARLLFTQFNLIYGNDWFLVPLELEIGSLTHVHRLIVRDNFGLDTLLQPTRTEGAKHWDLFTYQDARQPTATHQYLFFPNVVKEAHTSNPVEEIHFMRDEMANLVWAIESRVPDWVSSGQSGSERVAAVQQFLSELAAPASGSYSTNSAQWRYQLASTTPENWIPFIPVRAKQDGQRPAQVLLQRASMPRVLEGFPPVRIRPQTPLLGQGLSATQRLSFYLHEEEVPRSGIIVSGRWKRARWLNGEIYTWYGYEKRVGRGEGHSGLRFDYLEPINGA